MARALDDLEALLEEPDGPVRLDADGQLHLKPLAGDVIDPVVLAERDAVLAREGGDRFNRPRCSSPTWTRSRMRSMSAALSSSRKVA